MYMKTLLHWTVFGCMRFLDEYAAFGCMKWDVIIAFVRFVPVYDPSVVIAHRNSINTYARPSHSVQQVPSVNSGNVHSTKNTHDRTNSSHTSLILFEGDFGRVLVGVRQSGLPLLSERGDTEDGRELLQRELAYAR